jgi:hypothetical protein
VGASVGAAVVACFVGLFLVGRFFVGLFFVGRFFVGRFFVGLFLDRALAVVFVVVSASMERCSAVSWCSCTATSLPSAEAASTLYAATVQQAIAAMSRSCATVGRHGLAAEALAAVAIVLNVRLLPAGEAAPRYDVATVRPVRRQSGGG